MAAVSTVSRVSPCALAAYTSSSSPSIVPLSGRDRQRMPALATLPPCVRYGGISTVISLFSQNA